MSEEKKTKRGGKREGAGRPSAGPLEKITILVRADQKEAIDHRGNRSEQIRAAIDLYLDQQAVP